MRAPSVVGIGRPFGSRNSFARPPGPYEGARKSPSAAAIPRLCFRRSKSAGLPPPFGGADEEAERVAIATTASARSALRPSSAAPGLGEREDGDCGRDGEERERREDRREGMREVHRDAEAERAEERADVRDRDDEARGPTDLVGREQVDGEQQRERE